jgi:diazepam-binding inhibitor (GABA receptor modulating acyl-CoA-binding protein)
MSDDLKSQFEKAMEDVKGLSTRPADDDMLNLYALYKQASSGDVSGDPPGMFDFVGKAKHEAWSELTGLSSDDAMTQYIEKVRSLGA